MDPTHRTGLYTACGFLTAGRVRVPVEHLKQPTLPRVLEGRWFWLDTAHSVCGRRVRSSESATVTLTSLSSLLAGADAETDGHLCSNTTPDLVRHTDETVCVCVCVHVHVIVGECAYVMQ